MKIYFAGAIRAGRDDQKSYFKIIDLLKNYGEVLTEHVGGSLLTVDGENLPEQIIYERDMAWLKSSDVLVAEVTTHSTGVGYEIAYAEILKKKILCLYREGAEKKISGMIVGNKNLTVRTYKTIEDLADILQEFFK